MAKAKTSVMIDRDLLKAAERKAAESGETPEAVVEGALRRYVEGPADILRRLGSKISLTDEEAMELA